MKFFSFLLIKIKQKIFIKKNKKFKIDKLKKIYLNMSIFAYLFIYLLPKAMIEIVVNERLARG